MRRCHDCNSRFIQFGDSLVRMADLHRVSRKLLLGVAMAAAAAIIMVAILMLSHAPSAPGSESGRLAAPEIPVASS